MKRTKPLQRRKRLRAVSKKTAQEKAAAKPWRDFQCEAVGRCEVCLKSRMPYALAIHEIWNGYGARSKCLDKPFGTLVVCREPWEGDCHGKVGIEPEAKQLARLYLCRPGEYDLVAFLEMSSPRAPDRITQSEVDRYVRELLEQRKSNVAI